MKGVAPLKFTSRTRWLFALGAGLLISVAASSALRDEPERLPIAEPAQRQDGPVPANRTHDPDRRSDEKAMLAALDTRALERRKADLPTSDPFAEPASAPIEAEPPKPQPKPVAVQPLPVTPAVDPPKPQAPALPFRYVGKLSDSASVQRVFVARGNDGLALAVGDTVDESYRLVEINANELVFLYLPLQVRQVLGMQ